ncbi:MAG: ABC transporter permease [Polyangiales bacterium]
MKPGALRYLAGRLAWAIGIVALVAVGTFLVDHALPSDPARMIAGPQARPADVARIRTQLSLDQPLTTQLARWSRRLVHVGPSTFDAAHTPDHESCAHLGPVHLDLGRSHQQHRPVVQILSKRWPFTAALAIAGTTLSVLLGALTGVFAALRKGKALDAASVGLAVLGVSTPTFILGVLLQWIFADQLQWLPLNGAGDTLFDRAKHLVLPALTLGLFGAAYYTRLVRSELLELLEQDFVRTARAKGASGARVVVVHALRTAMLPLVTAIGLELGALLGGAVVTEQIFSWPGLGQLAVRAVRDRDGPVLMGTVLVSAVAIVACNLIVDALTALLDPRVGRAS